MLPFVTKPGRYVGNEWNSIRKPHDSGLLKIALCFPEMYEIGMSYLGMHILYHIINQRQDSLAERAFSIWPDMEKRMKERGVPLFSLESSTPLSEFDILGFHLTYEMTFATALNMLQLSGIPLLSKDRGENLPLILAGGSSVMNPEPMADFIDAFFIGDAEEAINEIIDSIKESKTRGLSRESTLLKLAQIPGIYVPRFYEAQYDPQGNFLALRKTILSVPETIRVRSVPELQNEHYPPNPLVPFVETTHDHLSVEIMRGCVRGCRFCQAGYQYRPRRQRPPDAIASQLFTTLTATGYDDVTLLSLSSTDYDHLGDLLGRIGPRLSDWRVGLGLPSLRPETLTASLLDSISATRKTGLTLAPEAGTERLRNIAGKGISDSDILAAIDLALESGWQAFKLYFMIGLPTESKEDIEGMISLLRKISFMARQRRGKCNINVAVSPFNPKSHTPWQWEQQVGVLDLRRKIDRIIDGVRKPNINIKYRGLELSFIEGIIGRGDRRLGRVILKAFQKGARLDGWSEWFDAGRWDEAFAECGIDPGKYATAIDPDAPLPWDHIDKGISKNFLKKDNQKSKEGVAPPSGIRTNTTTQTLSQVDAGYGRKARRTVRQSAAPSGTYKIRVRYSRGPEMRYLSHLDIIRTLYRALRRSEIPVAFSEGYHPHIKLSFGPPLPVGYTSDAEYFDLQLTQPYREEFITRLGAVLPEGLAITGHRHFFTNVGSLSKQLNLARYWIPAIDTVQYDREIAKKLVADKSIVVRRSRPDGDTELDAGKFIEELAPADDGLLLDVWQLPDGHIKPEEILIFGMGIDSNLVKPLTIHRKSQFHKSGQRLVDPLDLV